MNNLKAKLKKQGGFTLVELLIVVAIIAILVAVSIPMMNQALEKSREAVDTANERDAKSLAITAYMTIQKGDTDDTIGINNEGGSAYYTVADDNTGALVKDKTGPAYGQGQADIGAEDEARTGSVIKVTVTPDTSVDSGVKVETAWETVS